MKRLLYCFFVLVLVSCKALVPTPSALTTDSDSGCFHRTLTHRPVYVFDRVLAPGIIHSLFDKYLSDTLSDSNERRRLLDFKINSVEVQPEDIASSFSCAIADGAKSISIVDISVKPFLQENSEWIAGDSEMSGNWINNIHVYVDILEENEEYYLVFLDPDP